MEFVAGQPHLGCRQNVEGHPHIHSVTTNIKIDNSRIALSSTRLKNLIKYLPCSNLVADREPVESRMCGTLAVSLCCFH